MSFCGDKLVMKVDVKKMESAEKEFVAQIAYCIECQEWVEIAIKMEHLRPMANLLKFIRSKLDRLHVQISYQTLRFVCFAQISQQRLFIATTNFETL